MCYVVCQPFLSSFISCPIFMCKNLRGQVNLFSFFSILIPVIIILHSHFWLTHTLSYSSFFLLNFLFLFLLNSLLIFLLPSLYFFLLNSHFLLLLNSFLFLLDYLFPFLIPSLFLFLLKLFFLLSFLFYKLNVLLY